VDQTARDMETEAQKPQNQQNNENCPKHGCLPLAWLSALGVRLGSQDRFVFTSTEVHSETIRFTLAAGRGDRRALVPFN
jgi:hypothetical protein